jgi:hypothetical protein
VLAGCEHDSEPCISMNKGKFLHELSDYYLLKKELFCEIS